MTDTQCAYLAGLFDGEGNIHIHLHQGKTVSYSLRISITSTDILILQNLQAEWNIGKCSFNKQKSPKHKIALCWQLYGQEAQNLLSQLLPYLKIKRERAELALKFKISGHGNRLSSDALNYAESIWSKMHDLNRRGNTYAESVAIH